MLRLVTLLAPAASVVPSASAGYWFYTFETCLLSSQIVTADPKFNVFYATLPSEPKVCASLEGSNSNSYVAVNETTIVQTSCKESSSEGAHVYQKFTGGVVDCESTNYARSIVFWPIPAYTGGGSGDAITVNHALENLPPVDSVAGATAAVVSLQVKPVKNGYCVSRALSNMKLTLVWETCSVLPHKQGALISKFESGDATTGSPGYLISYRFFESNECKDPTKLKKNVEFQEGKTLKPPSTGGKCDDMGFGTSSVKLNFPGWPLDKASKFPTDSAPYTSERDAFGQTKMLPVDVDGDTLYYPYSSEMTGTVSAVSATSAVPVPFEPKIPKKPQTVIDNSFDAYPDSMSPSATASVSPGLPGLGGNNGKNSDAGAGVGKVVSAGFVAALVAAFVGVAL
ncbi:hypothetical protein HDU97_007337 [Phlyctochytrium planicorne]|nr:hypothetical protein HDU97_007337 [Phlyctochytrium planicorne]